MVVLPAEVFTGESPDGEPSFDMLLDPDSLLEEFLVCDDLDLEESLLESLDVEELLFDDFDLDLEVSLLDDLDVLEDFDDFPYDLRRLDFRRRYRISSPPLPPERC